MVDNSFIYHDISTANSADCYALFNEKDRQLKAAGSCRDAPNDLPIDSSHPMNFNNRFADPLLMYESRQAAPLDCYKPSQITQDLRNNDADLQRHSSFDNPNERQDDPQHCYQSKYFYETNHNANAACPTFPPGGSSSTSTTTFDQGMDLGLFDDHHQHSQFYNTNQAVNSSTSGAAISNASSRSANKTPLHNDKQLPMVTDIFNNNDNNNNNRHLAGYGNYLGRLYDQVNISSALANHNDLSAMIRESKVENCRSRDRMPTCSAYYNAPVPG
ncbi:MAG: hypothetical protein MHMPM18_003103, partial [Marteilia pararefringens]